MSNLFLKNAPSDKFPVLLVTATKGEFPLPGVPDDTKPLLWETNAHGLDLLCLVTGPGPLNAAIAIGGTLSRHSPGMILLCGIGGAYPGSGLAPGDLAVATEEIDSDFGVESLTPDSPPTPLAIPGYKPNFLATDESATDRLFTLASKNGKAAKGTFLTSATVTATGERAARLENMHGPICENMEGFAVALAASMAGIPFAQIRGISNLVGPRDPKTWVIEDAVKAYSRVVAEFLHSLGELN